MLGLIHWSGFDCTIMTLLPANSETIALAAEALCAGKLVAFPTETVYGLGADAGNDAAVASIYAAKGRPSYNPLITHVADWSDARQLVVSDQTAETLAEAYWPGPMTLVLNRNANAGVSELVSAGQATIGLRVPSHPVAQELLRCAGRPIVAPSANRSGGVSPTSAAHVIADIGECVAIVLDGGRCDHGIESTVLRISGGEVTLLRPGSITREQLERTLGRAIRCAAASDAPGAVLSPGRLSSHYAPRASLRLNAAHPHHGEVFLAFGPTSQVAGTVVNLSERGDLREAAANLFAALRDLDATGADCIAVMPIPHDGVGAAINDRLNRAAAPRVPPD